MAEKQSDLFKDRNLKAIDITDEIRTSYMNYSMSVLVGRALPDVRDGLKPVHRRILYAMHEQGFTADKPYKKSARIVGEVLGKYHPHGDTAVYDSLVRMAQNFSLRYPLIDGQGNFGSVDGDNAAAMRYTEARMHRIGMEMLDDIRKETVDFVPNFDESLQEPTVLPGRLPALLVNGTSGIAVGMATSIPPHNLSEVIDAIQALIDNSDIEIKELLKHIKGPDFPTGGVICGRAGLKEAYATGRGKVILRGVSKVEESKKGDKQAIVITEIPYQVNKASLIIKIAELVNEKKLKGVGDLRDESDRKGMRIYIEVKRDSSPEIVLNQLYKHTPLQNTFSCNFIALDDGVPRQLNLKQMLERYRDHRVQVITRRTQFDLRKAEERMHIVEGLRIAVQNIDAVIKIIRKSKDTAEAREALMKQFKLSEIQSNAILDMRLAKLTSLEIDNLEKEHKELSDKIKDLQDILKRKERVLKIIVSELAELKERYGDKRRTGFAEEARELSMDELVEEETVAVIMTKQGFVKRLPIDAFRSQLRGGRGVNAMATREEDIIEKLFITSTHSYLLCFTNWGKAYRFKVYDVPDASRQSKGISLANVLQLKKDERVTAAAAVDNFEDEKTLLVMATRMGTVKKVSVNDFRNLRNVGITAITLDQNDELLFVSKSTGDRDVFLASYGGMVIRFAEKDVRQMGRNARGVRGIKLKKDDQVVSMDIVEDKSQFFVITSSGRGKNTPISEYRAQGRGGQGVRLITLKGKDKVAAARVVKTGDELLVITENGTVSRQKIGNISVQGRQAMGVRVQRVDEGDQVVAIGRVMTEEI